MQRELTIKIGGEAGQGVVTIGSVLSTLLAEGGYYLFNSQDYESRIRGGHNLFQIRISEEPVWAMSDQVDLLIALNQESVDLHLSELQESSMIIYDREKITVPSIREKGLIGIYMDRIARECGGPILVNTVAVAVTAWLLGYEFDYLEKYLHLIFKKKADQVIKENITAARQGYEEAAKLKEGNGEDKFFKFQPGSSEARKILITGKEAIAIGALAAGCKFYTAYPMTPSTGILTYMASHADQFGVVVEQAEDEIAAINMAIGASFAGARSMTGTSGGGFDLMVEGLSLAGMTETPVVIVLGQRPGPATGLPTRTEQAELLYAIHAAHGEFPRLVLAPGNPEEAFYLTAHAFNQAEKYQIPVIILTDQHLADSSFSYDNPFNPEQISINRYLLSEKELSQMKGNYKRYAFTETGISPRAIPGQSSELVMVDSDEHDESGHIIEDIETRKKQVDKRLKKGKMMEQDIIPPVFYGHPEPETILICWGSTWGIVYEAMKRSGAKGNKVAMLHFTQLWPFPGQQVKDLLNKFKNKPRIFDIENNATGQLGELLWSQTDIMINKKILKSDGRPFSVDYLLGII